MSTLVIQDLVVRRGNKAVVDSISLTIETGRITSLIGPNGAGKSSLVLALAGVLPIERGSVKLDGVELVGAAPDKIRACGLAAVPEGHRVLAGLSVDDNLQAAGFLHTVPVLQACLAEVYGIFPELAERKAQKAGTMSGGQQQMLALGQALMAKPKFILADEMSLGLAPLIVKRLMDVVDSRAKAGTGILLIEQFTSVALRLANEACVISGGRFRYQGDPQPLIDNPDILHRAYLAV